MIRDPLYQSIIAGLSTRLDPEIFERCAAALLRPAYPGLVPIRGGGDAGMDGAIADGEGPAFPLVSTTSNRVLDNLRGSLRSYRGEGEGRQKVVFATSSQLSPKSRRNLVRAAADLGFTLVQIHDQAAFADLLYRSPEWCRELLQLSGQPPALSALPLTSRPVFGDLVIGRDADLAWLSGREGDSLLIGQPGSGKTFVLREMVARGDGLFAVSEDPARIAEAIRAQKPSAIFVDDAHLQQDLLRRLLHLRAETGAEFRIVATCWPGEAVEVAKTLGVPKSATWELALLTRKEIADVIRSCGIAGPAPLLRELINQAKGRPGLAVTLCFLCRRDGIRDVVTATGLYEDVRTSFGQLVGPNAVPILAGFAVGGEAGMPMPSVAEALGIPLLDVHRAAVQLAAGGVLTESHDRSLVVQPEALRYALVGQVFFGGAGALPIEPLLVSSSNLDATVLTLLGAWGRGSPVSDGLLRSLLFNCREARTWRVYASCGAREALWVLEHRPDLLHEVAWAALDSVPNAVIPLMLARAVGDNRPLNSATDHPLRILQDWTKAAVPGEGEAVERRRYFLDSLLAWHASGAGDPAVCLRALSIVFSPAFEDNESDPVDEVSWTLRFGTLLADEIDAVQALWERAAPLLKVCGIVHWEAIRDLINEWAYPGLRRGKLSAPEVADQMRRFAEQIAGDVLAAAGEHQGVALWTSHLAERLHWHLEVSVEPAFEILFPGRERDYKNLEAAFLKQSRAATELADKWIEEEPGRVAVRLVEYENAALFVGLTWPTWTEHVARRIADTVADPMSWACEFVVANAPHQLVAPFLRRIVHEGSPGWEELWGDCYARPALRGMAILIALKDEGVSLPILERALEDLTGMADAIGSQVFLRQMPDSRLPLLLRHPDREVAAEVAWGIWHADPEGLVPPMVAEDWRHAVVTCEMNNSHCLEKIFESDSSIALDWLLHRIATQRHFYWRWPDNEPFTTAVKLMTLEQRRELLDHLRPDTWPWDIVADLIGRDTELFRILLSKPELKNLHLRPLEGGLEPEWIPLAVVALDAGYTTEEVAEAAHGILLEWEGNESQMWSRWAERFQSLESHIDQRVRQIGRAGREDAEKQRDRALAQERHDAVHGRRR